MSRSNLRITLTGLRRSVAEGEHIAVTLHTADGYRIPLTVRAGKTLDVPAS